MKVTLWSVFVVLVLSYHAGASATRFDMKLFPPPPVGPALEGISAYLLVEHEQLDVSKGIEFSLVLENTGTALFSLVHEWQNVRLFLRNEQGLDVEVPDPLRHYTSKCRKGPEVPPSPEKWAQAVAKRSLKYITDESPKASNEQHLGKAGNESGKFHIDLGPGRKQSFRFRVDVIMGDPERYWAEIEKGAQEGRERAARGEGRPVGGLGSITPPTVIPIPPGNYALGVSIDLWEDKGPGEDKGNIGSFVNSDFIKVRLGPPPGTAGGNSAP